MTLHGAVPTAESLSVSTSPRTRTRRAEHGPAGSGVAAALPFRLVLQPASNQQNETMGKGRPRRDAIGDPPLGAHEQGGVTCWGLTAGKDVPAN